MLPVLGVRDALNDHAAEVRGVGVQQVLPGGGEEREHVHTFFFVMEKLVQSYINDRFYLEKKKSVVLLRIASRAEKTILRMFSGWHCTCDHFHFLGAKGLPVLT